MNTVEIQKPTDSKVEFTDDELIEMVRSSSFIQEKMKEGHRIIAGLMEKYPDLDDRLSGKVPHP